MRFTCERSALLEAVQNLSRIVTKTSLPVLEGVLISAEKGKLTLISYNLEISMKKEIYANCEEEGDIVISARLLSEILRRCSTPQIEIESDSRLMCFIRSGNAVFDIMGMKADDFPEIPTVPETEKLSIAGGLLKDMVKGTLFAVAQSEGSRPILTGLNIRIDGGVGRFVGIDGRRIAIRKENIASKNDVNFVISSRAIGEAVKIITNDDENIDIFVSRKLISFDIEGYIMVSRLLEGEFLNFERALPKDNLQEIVVKTRDIIDIIERISLVVSDKFTTPIRCRIERNLITFTCLSSVGKAVDTYETELKGEEFEIGINSQYLLDALRACDSDEVTIKFKGSKEGFVIEPRNGDSFIYMIMPMMLK